MLSLTNIAGNVGVVEINNPQRCSPGGVARKLYKHTLAESQFAFRVFVGGGTDFGAFGINHYADARRYLAAVAHNACDAFFAQMGRIHAYYIHACLEQTAYEVHAAAAVRNCGDYLGALLKHITIII